MALGSVGAAGTTQPTVDPEHQKGERGGEQDGHQAERDGGSKGVNNSHASRGRREPAHHHPQIAPEDGLIGVLLHYRHLSA